MTAWMLYTVAASAVIALAASFLEYGLRGRGLALRWVWVAALTGSVMLSVAPWIGGSETAAATASAPWEVVSTATDLSSGQSFESGAPMIQSRSVDRLSVPAFPELDRVFLGIASVLAAMGLALFVGSYRRLVRRRRSWRATTIEGIPALISRSIGPAVVGYLHPAIVLPEWVTGMDDRRRRLIILHEQEHLDAKDNQLLGFASLVVMLMPWNAPLWWQLRRLRQGVELDCDRRVLTKAPDAEGYGELLIEMGQRSSAPGFALAAFAESSSFLERRIRSIFASKPRRARLVLGAVAAFLLASFLFAWEPPSPRPLEASVISPSPPASLVSFPSGSPEKKPLSTTAGSSAEATPEGEEDSAGPSEESAPAATVRADVASSEAPIARRPRVEELVQRDYPGIFRNGLAIDRAIWFAIDRNGNLRRSWIGPNLYINLGATVSPLREMGLPEGTPERANAVAEHQRREQEVLRANVPDLEIRSMYAGYFSGGGGSTVVHFVTEDPGAGNWGRFRVASAFVADAIDSALGQ